MRHYNTPIVTESTIGPITRVKRNGQGVEIRGHTLATKRLHPTRPFNPHQGIDFSTHSPPTHNTQLTFILIKGKHHTFYFENHL